MNDEQQAISQKVDNHVKMLIGDLHLQLIVLKAQLDIKNEQPIPVQATNGKDHEKRPTL
jgi:hypothetical protein